MSAQHSIYSLYCKKIVGRLYLLAYIQEQKPCICKYAFQKNYNFHQIPNFATKYQRLLT